MKSAKAACKSVGDPAFMLRATRPTRSTARSGTTVYASRRPGNITLLNVPQ